MIIWIHSFLVDLYSNGKKSFLFAHPPQQKNLHDKQLDKAVLCHIVRLVITFSSCETLFYHICQLLCKQFGGSLIQTPQS